ncbi:SET domain containing protein [Histomonas meleagridis]|nr:SET domain containing protein [Histomonas meleagridis]
MFNKSKIHQWGIFSAAPFNNGEPIIEFHGKITNSPGTKSYKIDEKNYFDPTGSGSLARYVNHSCNPNCILKIVNISGRQAVYLYSRQYIRPSEELCIDYKLPPCNKSDAIPCNCGSSNCRKYINNYEFVKKSGRQKQRKKEPHDVIQRPKEARLLFSSIHQLCPSIKMDQDLLQDYLMISDIDDQEEEEHSERNEQQTPQTKKTGKNAHNSKKKSESVEPNNKEKDKKKTSEKQKKETKAQETEKSRKRKTENEAETREKEKVKNPNQTKKEKVKKSKENETENKAQKQRGRTKRVANSPEPKENEVPKKNAKNTKNANNKKLKKEEEKSKEIPVAKLYDNFLRNVISK